MQPVVLDTDVASLLHRRKLTGHVATRLVGREPLITFVTFGELIKWPKSVTGGAHRREELSGWLSGVPVLPGDEAVGTVWDAYLAAFQRGRPRPVNDMWIAACCLAHQVPLATLNLKDFEDFSSTTACASLAQSSQISAQDPDARHRLHGHQHYHDAEAPAANSLVVGSSRWS